MTTEIIIAISLAAIISFLASIFACTGIMQIAVNDYERRTDKDLKELEKILKELKEKSTRKDDNIKGE